MLSSMQVAAMMQQQQQMFMGMQQYSQVISAQMPQPMMNTIGSYGMQQQMSPQFAQVPYAPRQQGGFSYGGGGFGYGMGNQWGAAGMAGMAGAGQMAMGGLGIAGGLGLLGRAGMAFDPIGAGMATAGRFGIAAGLGVGGAMLGVGAMAGHAVGSMVTGAQEQAGINQSLGQFNFINSGSRSGRGFSRSDAMAIGQMTRELQSIPEMMTSMSELTRIMDKMGQSGMMQGVRDAGEFSKKFRETIHTLKDVSKMMGSTMEEAMQAFQESRQSGFYSPQAIKQNIMQRQIVGGLTGMNQGQVAAMQQYGADVSHQMGGSRAGGARGIARIAGELGMAQQQGLLSDNDLIEMTGQGGSAGMQALAGSLNDVGQKMGRSSLGTAMTLAMGEVKDGRYTGGMDQSIVQRVRAGQISKEELLRLAHQKSQGRGAKLSFAAHRGRLTTEMVNAAGAQGIAMELGTILGERGFDNPDALNLVMQRYGANEEQANQIIGLMKKMPGIQRGIAESGDTAVRQMAEQAYMRDNASFEGLSRKIGKRVENVLTQPFKEMGAGISNAISEGVDRFVDDLFGRYQTTVSRSASDTVRAAQLGSNIARQKISIAQDRVGKMDMSQGRLQRVTGMMGDIARNIAGDSGFGISSVNLSSKTIMGAADYVESGDVSGMDKSISSALGSSGSAAHRISQKLAEGFRTGAFSADDSEASRAAAIEKAVGPAEMAALMKEAGGTPGAEKLVLQRLLDKSGLGNQAAGFTRKGLAEGYRGLAGLDAKGLSDRANAGMEAIADQFGGPGGIHSQKSKVLSMLRAGGAEANFLSKAFGGADQQQYLLQQAATSTGELTVQQKAALKASGISEADFEKMRGDDLRKVVERGAKNGFGGAAGAGAFGALGDVQLVQAANKSRELQAQMAKELQGSMTEFAGDNAGIKSKAGRRALAGMSGLVASLKGGGGLGDDIGATVAALADTRGAEHDILERQSSPLLQYGESELLSARQHYRHTKGGGRYGKSLAMLGYTEAGLAKQFGVSGDLARTMAGDIAGIAGSDKHGEVNAKEAEQIAQYLAKAGMTGKLSRPGTEQSGVAGATKSLQSYMDEQTKAMANINTALQALMPKKE